MFDQLIASQPDRNRSTPQMIASVGMHTVIIAVSIHLTQVAAATVVKAFPQSEVLLPHAATPPAPHAPEAAAQASAIAAAPPLLLPAPPIVAPVGIAPMVVARGFDPARLGQSSDARSLSSGGVAGDPAEGRLVATHEEADEPAAYLDGPAPKYPPALRQVGIEGWVQLRFIVGVDGVAEPGSIEMVRTSNPSFGEPAIEAIRLARFTVARIQGRKVRQFVEQLVRFTLR